jgi:hypothetical protein
MNCKCFSNIAQGFRYGRKQSCVSLPLRNRKTKGANELVINEFKMKPASKPADMIITSDLYSEVLVSNLDWYIDYPEVFRGFLISSRQITKIITTRRYRSIT